MTMIPDTQKESYRSELPKIPEKRREVYAAILLSGVRGMALFEIQKCLQWGINCVSGRITELVKSGLVKNSGRRMTNPKTGKSGIVWLSKAYSHPQ